MNALKYKYVNELLTIFSKRSMSDLRQGPKYASV